MTPERLKEIEQLIEVLYLDIPPGANAAVEELIAYVRELEERINFQVALVREYKDDRRGVYTGAGCYWDDDEIGGIQAKFKEWLRSQGYSTYPNPKLLNNRVDEPEG